MIDLYTVWRIFFLSADSITKLYYSILFSFEQEGFDSKYDIHESYNQNNENPYESILELPAVDYLYVGYYYCVKNATVEEHLDTLVETGQASHIYLFVEGKFQFIQLHQSDFNRFFSVLIRSATSNRKGGQSLFERCPVPRYYYTM